MVTISTNSDIYFPFPRGMMEDGPQYSEDGSGLYPPIFGTQFPQPHGDIHYHQNQLDVQCAAGIPASQFDYTNINIHLHPHLLENPQHHDSYQYEFPFSQRNDLGLGVPPHACLNTYLPPPPANGGIVNLFYEGPPNRIYSLKDLRLQYYSSGGGSAQPPVIQTPESTRSSIPTSESQSTPHPQPTASTSRDQPPRDISNRVIACQQWRKIRCDSTRPICHNCVSRSDKCQYDAALKRRGPDKRPGTRRRSCKKRPTGGSSPPSLPSKRKCTSVRNGDFDLLQESCEFPNVPTLQPTLFSCQAGVGC
ncbi:uncharacterized protein F5891DRAFT_1284682 [Suillus fuscotomentosus]|uniref:Zn(2)-C6 fungal-type domain-containing protein n=1 Tax=Suillus fuscotomentosus TaxID=1912939 RepID=A0AAD4DMZ0_9AGAM|nr:uncharacterized protein F5891DRAFT_1284682 [Suillus fuscotomentosus]KAG1884511.1 hypothetical protein F5891DRAFT_1284682 [Suillus fuscotomentosus]